MRSSSLFARSTALALAASASLHAQLSTTVLSTNTGTYPISVVLPAPSTPQKYAIASLWQSSQQLEVNVTNPAAPVVGASATTTQDQYCRAWHTSFLGGRLVTAHRGGGIRLWDASAGILVPNLPVPQLSSTPTNYSHEGLKTFSHPLGEFVLYSEQHTSPSGFGGLIVYRINPTSTLTMVGQTLFPAGAGGALDLSADGKIVWQLGDQGNNQMNVVLRTYDNAGWMGNPNLLTTNPVPVTTTNADRYLEHNAQQSTLVAALGYDGIICYDIAGPNAINPIPVTAIAIPSLLHVRGVTFIPSTNFAVFFGFFTIGSTTIDFVLVADTTAPGSLTTLTWFNPGMQVLDAKVANGRLYCVGRDRVSLKSLMKIW
jgi:hypothetical protein